MEPKQQPKSRNSARDLTEVEAGTLHAQVIQLIKSSILPEKLYHPVLLKTVMSLAN
jgi:hypothetical protein